LIRLKNNTGCSFEIKYIYDASGVKWLRETQTSFLTVVAYCGSFVYKLSSGDTILDYVMNNEGIIKINCGTAKHQYFLKDHLGNNRTIISDLNDNDSITQDEILH
jgi:hypothetical protein